MAQAASASSDSLPLSLKEAEYVEEIGNMPDEEQNASETVTPLPLDNQEMFNIIREVARAHTGDDVYAAVSADREYETEGQPAYHQRHFGLGFGLVLFTQESGQLGALLRLMQRRDPATFADIFGANAQALLTVLNAPTPAQRLAPVGGELLWSASWMDRFKRAGAVPVFQAAQNEQAIEGQFRPILNVAFGLGLNTDRGLAMMYDCVVARGVGGGIRWVVQAAGPLRTAAQRDHALDLLGFEELAQFQNAVGWTPQAGRFDPETHAALAGALRRQGIATLPTADELMCQLIGAAKGAAKRRLLRLRDSAAFDDTVYLYG